MNDTAQLTQRSPEWLQARLGSLGASSLHEAIATTKTGWGASRANLCIRLVKERLTGVLAENYVSPAMQNGIETEPEAIETYAFIHGVVVNPVGLIRHPSIAWSHASPDGLVVSVGDIGDGDGLVEVKCPGSAAHIKLLKGETVPGHYVVQMMWQMACTGRAWCDFVSFDPTMPANAQYYDQRFHRDDHRIAELEAQAREFLDEVAADVAFVRAYGAPSSLAADLPGSLLMAG